MRLRHAHLWTQKRDASEGYCEDAFAYSPEVFVVSDGAAQGYRSGRWARLLCKSIADNWPASVIESTISAARQAWHDDLKSDLNARAADDAPLKWYEQAGVDEGAAATIIAVSFTAQLNNESSSVCWEARAVGDSCLFVVRDGGLCLSWPITTCEQFGFAPDLIRTAGGHPAQLDTTLKTLSGEWQIDDKMYIMTDAIAKWFLCGAEDGQVPWEWIDAVCDDEWPTDDDQRLALFSRWIAHYRDQRSIRDDDITVVRVTSTV